MPIDTRSLLAGVDLVAVVGHYVQLRKRGGGEFVGRCVWHSPDNNPSMCVVPSKGLVWCPACGQGGDAIDFIQQVEGVDFRTACKRLNGAAPDWSPRIAADPPRPVVQRITAKPPPDAPTPTMEMRELGIPEAIRPILDASGDLLGYECRYPRDSEGKSASRVWTWGKRGEGEWGWGCGVFQRPRPLYGLHLLAHRPEAPVVVVEGPKKADAAQELMPSYVAVSWTGGAQSWHCHDWSPLQGRTVIVWPDADVPGVEAAGKLAAHLAHGLQCSVRVIDPGGDKPAGWDAADALAEGWDWPIVKEWAKPRLRAAPEAPKSPQDAPMPHGRAAEGGVTTPAPAKPTKRARPALAVVDGQAVVKADPEGEQVPFALSDVALGEYFVQVYGQDWRHVAAWGKWYEWRGDTWQEDLTSRVKYLAVGIVRAAAYWPESASLTPDAKRKLSSVAKAGNTLQVATCHPIVSATPEQWDTDPWLMGVPGGVVDLRNGRMVEGAREAYITKQTAVAPAGPDDGDPVEWFRFLEQVQPDPAVRSYLKRLAGYCLTGRTSEQMLAFFWGCGANGKGTFMRAIMGVMGQYAVAAAMETFAERQFQAHPEELARLAGARLVSAEESDSNMRWAEGRIKKLTGEGKLPARFMHRGSFEFEPSFKLVLVGQHVPTLSRVNEAIKRRLHLVPWTIVIPEAERDQGLDAKLREEWPLILRWAIEGCIEWQESGGLRAPETVRAAAAAYMEDQDFIGQWLAECCERGMDHRGASGDLIRSYKSWAESGSQPSLSQRALVEALLARGFTLSRTRTARYIDGLRLLPVEYR